MIFEIDSLVVVYFIWDIRRDIWSQTCTICPILHRNRMFYIQDSLKDIINMIKTSILPEYPKVVLDGTAIVICYKDGEKEVWGYEPNKKIAREIANEIELGLKAIDYVSFELIKVLNEIAERLESHGVPQEYMNDYLSEGYFKISKWFNDLKIKPLPK